MAQSFVNNCRSKSPDVAGKPEGFQYQPIHKRSGFGMATTGVLANALLNRNDTAITEEEIGWLMAIRDSPNNNYRYYHYMLYGLLMNGANKQVPADGTEWVKKLIRDEQLPGGSWRGNGGLEFNHEFCTAACLLALTAERQKLLCSRILGLNEEHP